MDDIIKLHVECIGIFAHSNDMFAIKNLTTEDRDKMARIHNKYVLKKYDMMVILIIIKMLIFILFEFN